MEQGKRRAGVTTRRFTYRKACNFRRRQLVQAMSLALAMGVGTPWTRANAGSLTCPVTSNETVTGTTTNAGYCSVASGATLTNYNGTLTNQLGATLKNFGTVVNLYGTYPNAGALSNAGLLDNYGLLESSNEALSNSGTLNNKTSGTLNSTVFNQAGGVVNNAGTLNDGVVNQAGSVVNNSGTLNGMDNLGSGAVVNNSGTITGLTNGYSGPGTVNNSGYLSLKGNYGGTLTNEAGGTIYIDVTGFRSAYNEWYNSYMVNQSGASMRNAGNLTNKFDATLTNAGTLTNSGDLSNQMGVVTNSGVLTNTSAGTITNVDIMTNESGGTLINSGTINNVIYPSLCFYGFCNMGGVYGTLTNAGTLINQSGATLNNDYSAMLVNQSGSTLINAGTLNNQSSQSLQVGQYYHFNFGPATLSNDGVLTNESGGTLNNGGAIVNASTIANAGSFIDASTGTVTGTGTFTQSAGTTIINGSFSQTSMTINGGTLGGTGTLNVSNPIVIASGAIIDPGAGPGMVGTLTSEGTIDISGTLNIDLASVSIFDKLNVTGATSQVVFESGSSIHFIWDGAYGPSAGSIFDFLTTAGGVSGLGNVTYSFSGVGSGVRYQVLELNHNTALELDITSVPLPASSWLFLSGLAGLVGIGGRRGKVST